MLALAATGPASRGTMVTGLRTEAGASVDAGGVAPASPGRYEPDRRPRWISLGLIAALHAAGFVALRYLDVEREPPPAPPPMVLDLLPLDPPPAPAVALPTQRVVEPPVRPPPVVAPVPIVAVPPAPPSIPTTAQAAPPPPLPTPAPVTARTEEARPAPARRTDTVTNLSTRLLSGDPPRYPAEARRRRETGVVVLMVVVGEDGRVATISIATSSGVDRLDQAALGAVRRWRWSPTIVDGRPSQVRGLVRIPFELKQAG